MKNLDVVDFHAHILPKADHGSDSVEISLSQLELARLHGVNRIIATPHFYPHRHTLNGFLKRRDESYLGLREHMKGDLPDIRLGAEVLMCENLDRIADIEKLCIDGTRALLLELPFTSFSENYCVCVENLVRRGFDVILAHADRYNYKNIESMIYYGAKLQINADSIATLFKNKHIYNWAERGLVVALGSDIHNVNKIAYKKFEIAKNKFSKYIEDIKKASDSIWENSISHDDKYATV